MRGRSPYLSMLVVVGSLSLVSCATVLHRGGPETIMITSDPPTAQVTITDLWTRQLLLQATTPAVASLARHAGYMQPARYQVVVEKPGYQPYVIVLQAQLDERYFGNVVAGGPIGLFLIDPLTGAMYELPPRVHAVLARAEGTRAPSLSYPSPSPAPPAPSPSEPPPPPYESPLYRTLPPEERVR